jgi:hypothetical protein
MKQVSLNTIIIAISTIIILSIIYFQIGNNIHQSAISKAPNANNRVVSTNSFPRFLMNL